MPETHPSFETIDIHRLDDMTREDRDALPFGVVGFASDTIVQIYNATETRMSGLDPTTVMGIPFFEGIAQCMNNFMVAQRFEDEPELDDVLPYVLTLRMRPTKVRLRLLATAGLARRYVLIER